MQSNGNLQPQETAYGPHFIRRYAVAVKHPKRSAREVMRKLHEDMNYFSPQQNACFTKSKGEQARIGVGDEFDIMICGPNDGSVVVTDVNEDSFCFHTLKGHPEAGSITFTAIDDGPNLNFRIESHARSKDALIHLMYHTIGIGKAKQEETWAHFCRAVAEYAEGEPDEVRITTYRCDDDEMTLCTFEQLDQTVDEQRIEKVKEADQIARERKSTE